MTIAVLATVLGPRVTAGRHSLDRRRALVVGGRRPLRREEGADDADARARRADAQPGRPGRLPGRLRRELRRHLDRSPTPAEKAIHEVEIYIGILIGAVTFSGSMVAFGKLSGKIGGKPLLLPARHWINLDRPAGRDLVRPRVPERARHPVLRHDAADRDDGDRAAVRHPHGDGHRRRRHAGGRLDAQQLFGLGRGGHRLHARQRPADRHRRAGRLRRARSSVHHVPRDEPQLHQRDRRRLRHRWRRAGGKGGGGAARPAR